MTPQPRTTDGSDGVSVEVISLDEEAATYSSYLRSQRMVRAVTASVVQPFLAIVVTFAVALYIDPSFSTIIACLIMLALYVVMFHLYFWAMRLYAYAALRSVYIVAVAVATMTAVNVFVLYNDIVIFLSAIEMRSEIHHCLTLAAIVALQWMCLVVCCMMMQGPVRVMMRRRSGLFPLFINNNYDIKFWISRRALAQNLWRFLDVPATFNRDANFTAITAAFAALLLESSVYLWLFKYADSIREYLYRDNPPVPHDVAFLFYIFGVSVAPIIFRLSFLGCHRLRRYARRRLTVCMNEARLADTRPPILFLRSFEDDQISLSQTKVTSLQRFFDPLAIVGTLEELLLREFGYLGPVVAIGSPSDALPPLGAARRYCHGDTWREVVGSLMDQAALIVVGVERSEGLAWEIDLLRYKGLQAKTIFILPPASARNRATVKFLHNLLGVNHAVPSLREGSAALALSFFNQSHGLWLMSSEVSQTEYELALRIPNLRMHGGCNYTQGPEFGA